MLKIYWNKKQAPVLRLLPTSNEWREASLESKAQVDAGRTGSNTYEEPQHGMAVVSGRIPSSLIDWKAQELIVKASISEKFWLTFKRRIWKLLTLEYLQRYVHEF